MNGGGAIGLYFHAHDVRLLSCLLAVEIGRNIESSQSSRQSRQGGRMCARADERHSKMKKFMNVPYAK